MLCRKWKDILQGSHNLWIKSTPISSHSQLKKIIRTNYVVYLIISIKWTFLILTPILKFLTSSTNSKRSMKKKQMETQKRKSANLQNHSLGTTIPKSLIISKIVQTSKNTKKIILPIINKIHLFHMMKRQKPITQLAVRCKTNSILPQVRNRKFLIIQLQLKMANNINTIRGR